MIDGLNPRLDALRDVAQAACKCLTAYFGKELEITHKGAIDLVTQADKDTELIVVETLKKQFPDDGILAEEGSGCIGKNQWQWIVDPLDGTTNFASGLPHFGVSIALAHSEQLQAGIVWDPIKNECFEAVRHQGATLNGAPIQVKKERLLANALTATGFPYNRRERLPELLARTGRILEQTRGLRRLGSAALDLAYVAAGRFDVFLEDGLNPWDMAAGILLVVEAGGQVTGFDGEPVILSRGDVIACHGALTPAVVQLASAG